MNTEKKKQAAAKAVGREAMCIIPVGGASKHFRVLCQILAWRWAYGRIEDMAAPVRGDGTAWLAAKHVEIS